MLSRTSTILRARLSNSPYRFLSTMPLNPKIAFIGFGNIAKPFAAQLLRDEICQPEDMTVYSPSRAGMTEYSFKDNGKRYSLPVSESAQAAIQDADTVYLCIKPKKEQLKTLLELNFSPNTIIISFLAGVPIDVLQQLTGHDKILRAMLNTARSGGAHAKSPSVTQEEARRLTPHLRTCGCELALSDEAINSVTATSGSGIAYFFLLFECLLKISEKHNIPFSMTDIETNKIVQLFSDAMIEGAVALGLERQDATMLVEKTRQGACQRIQSKRQEKPEMPLLELLIEQRAKVTSDKGTTDSAIKSFISGNLYPLIEGILIYNKPATPLKALVIESMQAANLRAIDIANDSRETAHQLRLTRP